MIRLKNIDRKSEGGRRHNSTSVTLPSAVSTHLVFVAPLACRVDFIDVYSETSSTAACTNLVARLATNSDSSLQAYAGVISSAERIRLTPSANNTLSTGTPIELCVSSTIALSAAVVAVTYTPLIHRESR